MRMLSHIFVMVAMAVFSNSASAASQSTEVKQHFHFDPGSTGAYAVGDWLAQRRAEGQSIDQQYVSLENFDKGFVSLEIVTKEANAASMDTITRGGGTLPRTGLPGQTITIDVCTPGAGTVTETYTWVADGHRGGGWMLTDSVIHSNSNIKCAKGV